MHHSIQWQLTRARKTIDVLKREAELDRMWMFPTAGELYHQTHHI